MQDHDRARLLVRLLAALPLVNVMSHASALALLRSLVEGALAAAKACPGTGLKKGVRLQGSGFRLIYTDSRLP